MKKYIFSLCITVNEMKKWSNVWLTVTHTLKKIFKVSGANYLF